MMASTMEVVVIFVSNLLLFVVLFAEILLITLAIEVCLHSKVANRFLIRDLALLVIS